jgi:transposase InsO family protein
MRSRRQISYNLPAHQQLIGDHYHSKYPRFGSPRVHALLRAGGQRINHKRVERVWHKNGLQVPQRPKKRKIRIRESKNLLG